MVFGLSPSFRSLDFTRVRSSSLVVIGVDVFFVISGYLISTLILNGLRKGSFNYIEFYARRARRLFPALTVVLIFVWVLGWFAFDPTNFAALNKHIFAGAAFAANIVTYFEVGYFDEPASTKPLLHLWSLGVEEQFYLVFPALLVLVWRHNSAARTAPSSSGRASRSAVRSRSLISTATRRLHTGVPSRVPTRVTAAGS
jgi:peptidoglycan/LPS O-acetylase OafA/YrhL